MADAFINGLVAGLIILAAMVLVANTNWSSAGYATSGFGWFGQQSGPQSELILAELGTSYQVGRIVSTTMSDMTLGQFDVTSYSTNSEFPAGVVQSGIMFGEQTLKYSVEDPESIIFTVIRTNNYGNLIITANNEIVYNDRPSLGELVIPLNLEGEVDIKFAAASSGWKIWAPSLYEISDVNIVLSNPSVEYSFSRGEDFSWADLTLSLSSAQGTLAVNLNGKQLWSGSPGTSKVVSFSDDAVDETNTLEIRAKDNSKFTGTARLTAYYVNRNDKTYETTFNLTQEQIDKLPGFITFEVSSIQTFGTITAKLVVGDQDKLAESLDVKAGAHAIAFYKSNIVPGQAAKIVIAGSDSALFYIRNLKVLV